MPPSGSSEAIHPHFRQLYPTQTLGIRTLSWIEWRGDSKPGTRQGALDRTRPPLLVEPVARAISGARYVVLDTGHYAPIQTPELYVRTVDEFLDAIRA
jgi:pimeloyl-ACP methyl ester carboxylesterase